MDLRIPLLLASGLGMAVWTWRAWKSGEIRTGGRILTRAASPREFGNALRLQAGLAAVAFLLALAASIGGAP